MEITVVGAGRAAHPPERATLTLSANFEGADKSQVLGSTTTLVQALTQEIARLKEDPTHPTTWSAVLPIGTRSWRPWSDKGEVLPMRHAAHATLKITFRDFVALARFADAWGGVDGVTLDGVEWTLTEPLQQQTEAEVLASAVAHARERAQILATAGGGGTVRCLEIADPGLLASSRDSQDAPMAMYARSGAMGGAAQDGGIEIAPQDVEVQSVVHARFAADGG